MRGIALDTPWRPGFVRDPARFLMTLAVLMVVVGIFWTSSRYPSLGDKALMGGAIRLEDPLSFEALFRVNPEDPMWKRIGLSTVNWLDTNRQGMTFGVLLGTVLLSLLRYVERPNLRSAFANSALGLAIGTPMGVCANCAAPIGKGLYDGGARAETMMGTMLASPTLNVVVLSMLFGLLPGYMAFGKVALSVLAILLVVPALCRLLPREQLRRVADGAGAACPWTGPAPDPAPESVRLVVGGWLRALAADFWYIVRHTVPLMVLAGVLGATAATLLPIDLFTGLGFTMAGLVAAALLGLFLPVPMAFDVVICAALLAAGMPPGYVMALLFTLGIFSVYPAIIVSTTISVRAALLLSASLCGLGVAAGLAAQVWHERQTDQALEMLLDGAPASATLSAAPPAGTADARPAALDGLEKTATGPDTVVEIDAVPFGAPSPPADTLFTRIEAHTLGLDQPIEFSFKDMWPPFWEGRGITTGDVDGDGDPDVVIASTEVGLRLYRNRGGGRFEEAEPVPDAVRTLDVFLVALVDIDNDGWLDLFLSTYGAGNHLVPNAGGELDFDDLRAVPNRADAPLTMAASFGDVDRDGDLDLAVGNWAAGWYRRIPGEESRNRLLFNDGERLGGAGHADLPGLPGETLTLLFSDIDVDGDADLLVGNDFELPDVIYRNNGDGELRRVSREDGLVPHTTNTTMAIKSDDLDNDLLPDLYFAQIAGRASGLQTRLNMSPISAYCEGLSRAADQAVCQRNIDIKAWYRSGNSFDPTYAGRCLTLPPPDRQECQGMLVKDLAIQARDPSMCRLIPTGQPEARAVCDAHFLPVPELTNADIANELPQIDARNVLLSRRADGAYADTAVAAGVDLGGWSWDTKVGDYDNDGWADMLIVNGTWVPTEATPANVLFMNRGDGTFTDQALQSGIEDYLMTAAAAQLDLDNDGDLDVLTVPVNGPLQAYINNTQAGNAIAVAFDDGVGNRFGIGNRVTIAYGDGRQQTRELQLGGGFMSFDAPVAHFGLGTHNRVDSLVVDWADGGRSVVDGPLDSGFRYTVTRR